MNNIIDEIYLDSTDTSEFKNKKLSKKTVVIIAITLVGLIELFLIKPLIPQFFGMNLTWKVIYVLMLFGFPLLIIIPISIFLSPIAFFFKRNKPFKSVWFSYTKNVFFVFAIIILLMNSMLLYSKFIQGEDPFPLIEYSSIKGSEENLEDLKTGHFGDEFLDIVRYENQQVEKYKNGQSFTFTVEWISKNEYRLIDTEGRSMMNDTLDVKITNNTSEYYECYLRYGKYAQYAQVFKK